MQTVHRVRFGVDGNSENYLTSGYSDPEPGFTWAVNESSSVELPNPRVPGTYVLRLSGAPFVKESAPHQVLRVKVNGRHLGAARVSGQFELEWAFPGEMLAGQDRILVEFEHPGGIRPCDVGESD